MVKVTAYVVPLLCFPSLVLAAVCSFNFNLMKFYLVHSRTRSRLQVVGPSRQWSFNSGGAGASGAGAGAGVGASL